MGNIKQISVAGRKVGIVGLDEALAQMAASWQGGTEQELTARLLSLLGKRNYIAPGAEESYGKAFLREFRAHLGQPVAQEEPEGLVIRVLGQGCNRCQDLFQEVAGTLSELGLAADLAHITDLKEIVAYGVFGFPSLVINQKVVCVGKNPGREELKNMIRAAGQKTSSVDTAK